MPDHIKPPVLTASKQLLLNMGHIDTMFFINNILNPMISFCYILTLEVLIKILKNLRSCWLNLVNYWI